jgi:hypothetical protein
MIKSSTVFGVHLFFIISICNYKIYKEPCMHALDGDLDVYECYICKMLLFFFHLFKLKIWWNLTKTSKISRIYTTKTNFSQFLCQKMAKLRPKKIVVIVQFEVKSIYLRN